MKNWKTTLAGTLGGLIVSFGPSLGARLSGDQTAPPITSQNYLPAIAIAVIGGLAKDYDKSNSPTPVKDAQSTH